MEEAEGKFRKTNDNKTNLDSVFLSTFHYLITLIFCNWWSMSGLEQVLWNFSMPNNQMANVSQHEFLVFTANVYFYNSLDGS